MEKITINLLPKEYVIGQHEQEKFNKIQLFGIFTILMLIFLSSATIALRVIQSKDVAGVEEKVGQVEAKVKTYQNAQDVLSVLKNRTAAINSILLAPSKQTSLYRLIQNLTPPAVDVSSISVDSSGGISLSFTAYNLDDFDGMITNLSDFKKNEGRLGELSMDSFTRNPDGVFRVGVRIKSK